MLALRIRKVARGRAKMAIAAPTMLPLQVHRRSFVLRFRRVNASMAKVAVLLMNTKNLRVLRVKMSQRRGPVFSFQRARVRMDVNVSFYMLQNRQGNRMFPTLPSGDLMLAKFGCAKRRRSGCQLHQLHHHHRQHHHLQLWRRCC